MNKQILLGTGGRDRVLSGAKTLYDSVRVTLGPKGRNFIIGKGYSDPVVTHDGVTVANAVSLKDPAKEVGAAFIRKAARQHDKEVGDGTTTTTILTYKLIEGYDSLLLNPMQLASSLREEATKLCDQLKPIDVKDLSKVATISSGDAELGKLIAEAVESVGESGSVLVEPSQALTTELEYVEGFKIDSGYISPYMMTDPKTGRAVYENTTVLVFNSHLNDWSMIKNLLQQKGGSTNMVIIADDIPRDIIANLHTLRKQGAFNCLIIKSPGFGRHRVELLEDICAITGAKLIDNHDQLTPDNLGKIKRIVTDHESSIITGITPTKRIKQLKSEMLNAEGLEKERLNTRIASLGGKIATIHVGGNSEVEVTEKVYRIDDAVYASQAAKEEGILPGGGVAYATLKTSDTPAGKLFKDALVAPLKQLMENAGLDSTAKLKLIKPGIGFDVLNPDKPIKLIDNGIVDPAKVVRLAIKTAASIASQVITMGGLIADEQEKDEN